jgi:hypothetical protein
MDIDATRRNKKPRPLTEGERTKLEEFIDAIHYSARYVRLQYYAHRVNDIVKSRNGVLILIGLLVYIES